MFGFLGGAAPAGDEGGPASGGGHFEKLLAEKDEEIEDLNHKIQALRNALSEDDNGENEFVAALAEKNKVLEEYVGRVDELRQQNAALEARLAQLSATEHPGAGPTPAAPAAPRQEEGPPPEGESEALAEAQRLRQLAEEAARGSEEVCAQLRQQLDDLHQQLAHLAEDGEVARARAETGELAQRLAGALALAGEMRREADAKSGTAPQAFVLVQEGPEALGAGFEQRERRVFGRGWPVVRVREGTWAHTAGVQAGDELHAVNGHPVEAVPEEQVMALLQQRPLHLHWVRSVALQAPEGAGGGGEAAAAAAEPAAAQDGTVADEAGGPPVFRMDSDDEKHQGEPPAAAEEAVAQAERRARAAEERAEELERRLLAAGGHQVPAGAPADARVAELEAEVAMLQERAAAHAAEEARLLRESREQEELISVRAAALAAEEARLLQQSREQEALVSQRAAAHAAEEARLLRESRESEALVSQRAAAHAAEEARLLRESRESEAGLTAAREAGDARAAELESRLAAREEERSALVSAQRRCEARAEELEALVAALREELAARPAPGAEAGGAESPAAPEQGSGAAAAAAIAGLTEEVARLQREKSEAGQAAFDRMSELEGELQRKGLELTQAQHERLSAAEQAREESDRRARAETLAQQVASRIEELEAQVRRLGSDDIGNAAPPKEEAAPSPVDAGGAASQQEATAALRAELQCARARLSHLEDSLQAERAAHGSGAAGRLRAQVACLCRELTREREERAAREEALQRAAEEARRGDPAGGATLLEHERLRRQRDQARAIAQCIAHQTTLLAAEPRRPSAAGPPASPGAAAGAEGPGAAGRSPGSPGPVAESVDPEVGPASPQAAREGDDPERTLHGGAPSSPAGDEDGAAPRPPDEVTSGWDVFDPDESAEQTNPLTSGDGADRDGWGGGLGDLLGPLEADVPAGWPEGAGGAPELSDPLSDLV